jgi:hypothetical protein
MKELAGKNLYFFVVGWQLSLCFKGVRHIWIAAEGYTAHKG